MAFVWGVFVIKVSFFHLFFSIVQSDSGLRVALHQEAGKDLLTLRVTTEQREK